MNNLPKVVTQQRRGRASNPRLLVRNSDALPLVMVLYIYVISSVLAADLNGAGRGLNFVVVNADTKEVVRVARFDTFASGCAAV